MKKPVPVRAALYLTALTLLPLPAFAHTGGPVSGLAVGFAHPLSGWDHLLAMVAVGAWAAQLGGRARWQLPLAFVTALLLGAGLGIAGIGLPFIETGILLSVLALGAVIGLAWRPDTGTAALLVALFALFHGHVHGTEMPAGLSGLAYGLGFVSATALLHLGGLGAMFLLQRMQALRLARMAGVAVLAGGAWLAAG